MEYCSQWLFLNQDLFLAQTDPFPKIILISNLFAQNICSKIYFFKKGKCISTDLARFFCSFIVRCRRLFTRRSSCNQAGSLFGCFYPPTPCVAPLLPKPASICSNRGIKMACIKRESQIAEKALLILIVDENELILLFMRQLFVSPAERGWCNANWQRALFRYWSYFYFYFYPSLWIFQICIDPTFDHFCCRAFFSPKLMYKPPCLTKLICEHLCTLVIPYSKADFPIFTLSVGWSVGWLVEFAINFASTKPLIKLKTCFGVQVITFGSKGTP